LVVDKRYILKYNITVKKIKWDEIKNEREYFLKTIIPSRKATKKYLEKGG